MEAETAIISSMCKMELSVYRCIGEDGVTTESRGHTHIVVVVVVTKPE